MAKNHVISRRDLIKLGGTAAIISAGIGYLQLGKSAEVQQVSQQEIIAPVICGMCGANCGLKFISRNGRMYLVPNLEHPQPGMCVRPASALQLWNHPLRLKKPLKRVGDKFVEIDWDTALNEIAAKLKEIVEKYGPESVVITYHDIHSAILSIFAYLIGTPNLIGQEGTCHGVSTAARSSVLGAGGPPSVDPDYENATYIMLIGRSLNAAMGRVRHIIPARERGVKIVVVDPRAPNFAFSSVEWIPIVPGTDAAFLMSLAYVIINEKLYDETFIKFYTNAPMLIKQDGTPLTGKEVGIDANYVVWDLAANAVTPLGKAKDPALDLPEEVRAKLGGVSTVWELFKQRVAKYPPEKAAEITGIPASTITRIAREFATARGVIEDGWYAAKNGNEFDVYRLILILNALVGNIDKKGGLCFQQPLPFGGSCGAAFLAVTGVTEKLPPPKAPRLDKIEYPLNVATFDAVYKAILEEKPYPVKALFIVDTAVLHRDARYHMALEALKKLELVVTIDVLPQDHIEYAHYVLPDLMFLEREELTAVRWTLHAAIHKSHKVLDPPPGVDARNGDWALMEIIRRAWPDKAKIVNYDERFADPAKFKEWVAGIEEAIIQGVAALYKRDPNEIKKELEEKGFSILARKEYEVRPYKTKLNTPTGLVEIYSIRALQNKLDPLPDFRPPLYTPPKGPDEFYLITGKDQMTPFYAFAWNAKYLADRTVWMNPVDAERLGIKDGDEVEIESIDNGFKTRVTIKVTNRVRPGVLFVYAHIAGHKSRFITGQYEFLKEGINPLWFANGKIEPVVGASVTNATVRVKRV